MASFLARTLDREGSDARDYFADDATSAHQANINVIAALGVTGGSDAGTYNPAGVVRRDQMASFLARALAYRVDEADASLPDA